ncbi:Phosphoinositide phosphatase sac1 [Coemansia sp. RSA 1822]|nr:Phosphoinositide phosphatase sac1 [Coemansia sp. RSA 638]KAJ2119394.1 Phosphoinositide phosphatase sac1 [Coemansia sp. RSA 720]KAJ2542734.1 Phosphoinositide phosphatase sac1 [Coemansia sp. RSA 1853]KAJ2563372.1 Phosphoinositide phosphatase sac1 [Coemansia sp. RSA 1822]
MVTAQQTFKVSFYPATVTIEASRGSSDTHLVVDRSSGVVTTATSSPAFSASPQRTLSAHGVMGLINLQRGPYVVLITGREAVGAIGSSTVYRVSATRVVRVADDRTPAGFDAADEATYVRLLESALQAQAYYFSYDMDLTCSLQRQNADPAQSNDEFFFNKYLAEPIINAVGSQSVFVLRVIHGFFACKPVEVRGTKFNYVLVTRRGRYRQGTRYFSRGADAEGHVSNYAETEQIVDFANGDQMAYVQVRGSIPIAWAQVPNMHYVPELRIDVGASKERFQTHMMRMIDEYNEVVAVNLINKVKYEKPMGDAFATLSAQMKSPNYHYVHFDFHKECSRMRWDRITLLLDELHSLNNRFEFFENKANRPVRKQLGVVRTNCMDCLDRTNVVQSELARMALEWQLRDSHLFEQTESVSAFPLLRQMLNNVWADNADFVSCAYSGTGALKTDFTRTGKRTYLGALRDGRNSIERYVRGNFFDGERQDGIDLLLGTYRVQPGRPFARILSTEARALVGTMYVCLFMLAYAFFYPRNHSWFGATNIVFVGAWCMVLYLVFYTVRMKHTAELVNWPRLVAYPMRPQVVRTNASIKLPVDRWLEPAHAQNVRPTGKKLA